ncbi:hypothetical protein C8J57DRAFT_1622701 [Mycena rebaudengoi]|nr:hypothetical protein C8J57DRAFT_1622701 [Mycena rebaudengoi]
MAKKKASGDTKSSAPTSSSTCKPGSGRKAKIATAATAQLRQQKDDMREEFSNAKTTKAAYSGYLSRGRVIVADSVKERRAKEKEDPSWKCPENIDTDLLAKALEGPPNRHSVYALELVLTQKCGVEGHGKSTAEGIHGAFAKYWDELAGGKYAGVYSYKEDTDTVRGCPARAPEIQSFVKCIKTKARVKGAAATRHHAEAMTIEEIQKIIQWSESQCPSAKLESGKPANSKELLLMITHGMMRAFLSTGFVLFTRNFETCTIQERDLSDGKGPAPYYLPFLGVFLDNRKGWQQKQGYDGPLESHRYEIYEQKETPEIDMLTHVQRWRVLYKKLLGREFEATDYLFPFVSSNGTIHSKRPMTHESAQDLINEFAVAAGIVNKYFTTHCLRRGGSQYRFMFAPLGKRWSLSIIRWWGGWAIGEQVDTLMRYLLDSLQSYESGHGNALYPFPAEPAKSFMGDHNAIQPPTTAEFRLLGEQILTKLADISISQEKIGTQSATTIVQQISSMAVRTPVMSSSNHTSNHAPGATLGAPLPASHNTTPGPVPHGAQDDGSIITAVIPVPGAIIPGVGKDAESWKRAVIQWEVGDTARGLTIPLKDWPPEWHTGPMRVITGALYSNRKLLATEYIRLGRDDTAFKEAYPEYTKLTPLLKAIRQKNGLSRRKRT